ncbi:sensor histidine kinase [Devosia sp. PTR5]|uniref:histidine kinase n=1 Tax=Devosia oryzisoli TaxID=2774138 RepID=A0A927ISL4_9HYPH|nr:sensor histidine kinase [Devosia oryzisoli]
MFSFGKLQKVLILAPYRRDADYVRQLLLAHDIDAEIATDVHSLGNKLQGIPGVLVATHEALKPDVLQTVAAHLEAQPSWSELPVVVLLDKNAPTETVRVHLNRLWPRARHLFYHRPVKPAELISGVQSGLLARRRQQDLFENMEREVELRRELNHRVKNILASVTSIFEMTARQSASLDGLKQDFRGRLTALAGVHSTVFDADGEQVSMAAVAALIFGPYRQEGSDRILASGSDVLLNREAATTIALCLHELATNAIKYGALSVPEGKVDLIWSVDETSGDLSLEWTERGGPPAREPSRLGYGTRYLRSALSMLFGNPPTFQYAAEGFGFSARGNISQLT